MGPKMSTLLLILVTLVTWDRGQTKVKANLDIEGCHIQSSGHHQHHLQSDSAVDTSKTESDYADSVLCQIRTLQSDLDFDNLTLHLAVPMEKVTTLKVMCNDLLFFESVLSPGQLTGFSKVIDLSIEQCKLKVITADAFLGLDNLKHLKINTGNSDWAARSLELSSSAFETVKSLRSLHLGYNHMWALPQKLLCPLEALKVLNLTHNLLSDIDDLGILSGSNPQQSRKTTPGIFRSSPGSDILAATFQPTCLSELKKLDISHNTLRRLGSRRFENLKRLEDLRLHDNWLEEVHDLTLFGLSGLKSLNLSSNRLIALPSTLFHHSLQLRNLDLRNNSLSSLSPALFARLEFLVVLDLSRNSLSSQWMTVESFQGLVRLVILNLSHNQLTHLTPETFSDLYTLQVLDLSNNLISSIADSTFTPMSNLHELNLKQNKLVSIETKMFNGLYVLHKLSLDYNQITRIDLEAMKNCTSLSDLGLVGNLLTEVPEALRGLQYLKTLDLGENRISGVSNDSFSGMSQLHSLRLVGNDLEEIPSGVCDPMSGLRVLNVGHNKIKRVQSEAFVSCPQLRVLRLDSNALDSLPSNLVPQLPNLIWLNVSQNQIQTAHYSALPPSLEWFHVSHNRLVALGGGSGAGSGATVGKSGLSPGHVHRSSHHNAKLRFVDASHNLLTHLDLNSVPASLEKLVVSHNRLTKILPDTFSRSSHLHRVDLIGNQLETIPLAALRFHQIPMSKPLPQFSLGGNPFLCDCDMEYLMRITQLSATRQYPVVLDLDAIVCRLTYSRSVSHIPLPEMKPQNFLCPYTFHCFQTCQCCEFDACDCSMTCPTNCTCYHGDSWTANVVDCANSNLTSVPPRIPMDSTAVNLDGNFIPVLKSHSFIGRKTLRSLYLNSSRIDSISNKSFNGLQSLEYLHLQGNLLRRLHGYEFEHLNKLKELYLQDNLIQTISNSTFLSLKELEILRLDGNRISVFTVWQLSLNPYLVEIGLGRNSWSCDCHYLNQLHGWVIDNQNKVIDLSDIRCVWNVTNQVGPYLVHYNSTCEGPWALIQGEPFDLLGLLSLGALFLTILVTLTSATLIFVCRDNLRFWFHKKFGFRLCSGRDDFSESEKSYDAYFLYSQKDEEFVTTKVADEMETVENFRFCLHYRDLLFESGDLKEVMTSALDSSKSLVFFLSRNLLEGEWTNGEYRSAFLALLKTSAKKLPEGVKSIVVVYIEPIPEQELMLEFSTLLKSATNLVILKWTDKKFWSKFKFALPDPSASHYHSNITTSSAASSDRASSGLKFYTPSGGDPNLTFDPAQKYWQANFVQGKYDQGYTFPQNEDDEDETPPFLFQPNSRSPVPLGNFAKPSSSGTPGGSSYLNLEGEHVYSTLDPPSPTANIQMPGGYTGPTQHQYHWQPHPSPRRAPPRRKSTKEGSAPLGGTVQTYLV